MGNTFTKKKLNKSLTPVVPQAHVAKTNDISQNKRNDNFINNPEIALQNCKTLANNFLTNFKPLLIYQFKNAISKIQNGGNPFDLSHRIVKIIKDMDSRHVINDPKAYIVGKNNKVFFMCNGLILHNLIHNLMYLLHTRFLKLSDDNYKTIEIAYKNKPEFKHRPLIKAIYESGQISGYNNDNISTLKLIRETLYNDLNSYQAAINSTFPYLSEKQKETLIPLHNLIPMIEKNTSGDYINEYLKIYIKMARKN